MNFKKILPFMIIIILVTLCACEKKTTNSSENEIISSKDPIIQFDEGLTKKGIDFKKLELETPQNGSEKTVYYYFDDNSQLSVYLFDTNSEKYQEILDNGYITYEGTEQSIEIIANKGLVIEKNTGISNFHKIINILENIE